MKSQGAQVTLIALTLYGIYPARIIKEINNCVKLGLLFTKLFN
jgi:hypothetical protein